MTGSTNVIVVFTQGATMKTLIRVGGLSGVLVLGLSLFGPQPGIVSALDGSVRVDGGLVSGVTDARTGITAFKGIPFAAPPTGDLRWRPPAAIKAWTGVRSGEKYSAPCLQPAFPGGT